MLKYAMLFWIGKHLNAPSWYWWCWGIGIGLLFIKFGLDMYKAGAKL